MNIDQLQYFVTIIECNFNLSVAAEKLHISQPALSNLIVRFENNENVDLFVRKGGRLIGLTSAGEILYNKSKPIIHAYHSMLGEIRELSHQHGGVIRIGIPPLIISVLFTELLAQLISLNSNIKFEIMEYGAYRLIEELEQGNIDIAIILYPNYINLKKYNEVVLFEDELSAFINCNHPLAKNTESVTWKELAAGPLAIFDKEFMIYHYITSKFKDYNIEPNIAIESMSWDFQVSVARKADLITILPRPSEKFTNTNGIKNIRIEDPIPWNVSMVYPKKEHYSLIEKYIIFSIRDYFLKDQIVLPIDEAILFSKIT